MAFERFNTEDKRSSHFLSVSIVVPDSGGFSTNSVGGGCVIINWNGACPVVGWG